jgi:Notch-like protein
LSLALSSFANILSGSIPIIMSGSTSFEKGDRKKSGLASDKADSADKRRKKQTLLSLFEINVIRYSLYIDNMRPEYTNPFFLIDFMSLPEDYFVADAHTLYDKFLFRYGTHYIHAAEFGGQILFENSRVDEGESERGDVAEQAWKEMQTAFGSADSVTASLSVPTSFVSVDVGGAHDKLKSNVNAEATRKNDYSKVNQ